MVWLVLLKAQDLDLPISFLVRHASLAASLCSLFSSVKRFGSDFSDIIWPFVRHLLNCLKINTCLIPTACCFFLFYLQSVCPSSSSTQQFPAWLYHVWQQFGDRSHGWFFPDEQSPGLVPWLQPDPAGVSRKIGPGRLLLHWPCRSCPLFQLR